MKTIRKTLSKTFIFCSLLAITATACKKDKTPTPTKPPVTDTTNNEDTTKTPPYVSDTIITKLVEDIRTGTGWTMGMDIAANGVIYMYQEHTNKKGFYIHAYNTNSASLNTVFEYTKANWSNSNGSEGAHVRVDGDRLYVSGGATNNKVVVIKGVQSGALSFEDSIVIGGAYDMAFTPDRIFVIGFNSGITSVSKSNFADKVAYPFANGNMSHNAAIVAVMVNGAAKLALTMGNETQRVELRDLQNNFEKSVTTGVDGSPLVKDSKNRIYVIRQNKLIRYNANLEAKEEFHVNGLQEGSNRYAIALKENADHITVYYKNTQSLYKFNIAK